MLRNYLIQCRSLTYAQRAKRVLERAGLFAGLARVPQEMSREGCGHAVRIRPRDLDRALSLLEAADIERRKILAIAEDGRVEEVRP